MRRLQAGFADPLGMHLGFTRRTTCPISRLTACAAVLLAFGLCAQAQNDAIAPSAPAAAVPAAQTKAQAPLQAPVGQPETAVQPQSEEELRRRLAGKAFYLRGGYLADTLSFDERGRLIGQSPQGSYTLSVIQISRVRLTKRKLELEGLRYGLHFLGQLAYEDQAAEPDRMLITPKKKTVKIVLEREAIAKQKPVKEKAEKQKGGGRPAAQPAAPEPTPEMGSAEPKSPVANTPLHAAQMLDQALDAIFAPELDERMMERLPEFWRLYYQAVAAKQDYRPQDPTVLRQSAVDVKAKLISHIESPSNEYAQAAGVVGMALYHVVVGPDGKAGEIALARPIGFGLDENAVATIRKASFEPAVKDGKPVPVLLDLAVQFRIYSQRTAASAPESKRKGDEAILPGPFTLQEMK